ncbi:hypothetical protein RHMOL_Rhmol08G0310000 [Rhododendron molle]|uniref:Uncharacterized protein n=1 Tax=Rhododendron molle TaxID=49168 RepID=A0ACC0MVE9_RHOML|nr:hypothetical protein RHMOL_Rhmol08G0310000 [Rhododendron molle]
MKIPTDCSWTFRKLLRLRTVAFPFITKIIGNGESTFLWLDNWHPLGSLFSKFGNGIVFNLGRSLDARVSSIIADGCWRWPRARNAIVQKIIRHTPDNLVPHPDREDTVLWNLTVTGEYTSKSAWGALRVPGEEVRWHYLVWFKHYIPRWAMIQWIAFHGKLLTRDRLFSWGIIADKCCVLCGGSEESHDHIFFVCPFSAAV